MSKLANTEGAIGKAIREMRKAESQCARLRTMNAELLEAAREALWFLQNGELVANGERHPYTKWYETVCRLRRVIVANDVPNSGGDYGRQA